MALTAYERALLDEFARRELRKIDGLRGTQAIHQIIEEYLDSAGEYAPEMERRLENLRRLESDKAAQAEERRRCWEDPVYLIENYGWTFDPRDLRCPFRPWMLWPIQVGLIRWLEELENASNAELYGETGVVPKSRDTGVTWTVAGGFMCHRWLSRRGWTGMIGSRIEKDVDSSDNPKSVFEKMRLFLRMLPIWLMPEGFDWEKHSRQMKLVNPKSKATITGECGDNMGRSGRCTMYLLDESAFIEHPETTENALTGVSRMRVDVSTPNGIGNPFELKVHSGNFPVFYVHWLDDPRKNHWIIFDSMNEVWSRGNGRCQEPIPHGGKLVYPWQEKEVERLGEVRFAQEHDIDFSASIEGILVPAKWVKAAIDLHKKYPEVFEASARFPVVAGLDVADEGGCDNVFMPRQGPVVWMPQRWKEGGPTDTANKSELLARQYNVKEVHVDAMPAGVVSTWVAADRTRKIPFFYQAVNVGQPASDAIWPDELKSKDKFANLKAELSWIVRRAFERTYEFVELGLEHDPAELISIPSGVKDFERQLSLVRMFQNENGKIVIETKKQLASRGVKSPDLWDALVLSYARRKARSKVAVTGGKRRQLQVR